MFLSKTFKFLRRPNYVGTKARETTDHGAPHPPLVDLKTSLSPNITRMRRSHSNHHLNLNPYFFFQKLFGVELLFPIPHTLLSLYPSLSLSLTQQPVYRITSGHQSQATRGEETGDACNGRPAALARKLVNWK